MRQHPSFVSQHASLFPLAAALTVAFTMVAAIFIAPGIASAGEVKSQALPRSAAPIAPAIEPKSGDTACGCPQKAPQKEKMWSRPKFAELPPLAQRTVLDESDEIAALESVQFALSEVGDGASYIWHRNNGHLSGLVQPVASFKDNQGQVCRHVVVILTTGLVSKKAEGVACRLTGGQWKLEG